MYCRRCNYKLLGLSTRCPECGRPYDPQRPRTYRHKPRRPSGIVSRVLSIASALAVIVGYTVTGFGAVWYLTTSPHESGALIPLLFGGCVAMIGGLPLAVLVPYRWRALKPIGRSAFVAMTLAGVGLLPAAYGAICLIAS